MSMIGKLVTRDRALFVRYADASWAEPVEHVLWWKVEQARSAGYGEHPKEGDIATYASNGTWSTRDATTHRATGTICTGDGQTQADYHENLPIPAPKVRKGVEIRWYQGAWQKYLASKGWVCA